MNIGIDARLYGLEHAGIGRYVMNLVDGVVWSDFPASWTLFLPPKYCKSFTGYKNVKPVSTEISHYGLAEQTLFLYSLNNSGLDLLHVPHFNVPILYRRPFVVTIHDILWHQVRGGSVTTLSPFKYYAKYMGYKAVVNHAVRDSKTVFVPSNFVKQDLINTFPSLSETKIKVTYEGVTGIKPVAKKKLSFPYLIYIGSAYPHKNLNRLLLALKELVSNGYPDLKAVFVSSRSVFIDRTKKEVEDLKLTESVIFTGHLPDDEVTGLLSNAICLVHPSKSEGFGLTGLEAMSAGCPVIAARSTALPEIYSDAALYFEPDDTLGLVNRIKAVISSQDLRQNLIRKGFDRVASFSWESMIRETLKGYSKALNLN